MEGRDCPRAGRVAAASPPGECLLELAAAEGELDRVCRETPVGARGDAVPQRLHETDLAILEAELDTRAGQRVGLRALSFDAWLPHEQADARDLVELHRVAARGYVGAVD